MIFGRKTVLNSKAGTLSSSLTLQAAYRARYEPKVDTQLYFKYGRNAHIAGYGR
jgi:hypothetical protein